jgi:hypothetical protein
VIVLDYAWTSGMVYYESTPEPEKHEPPFNPAPPATILKKPHSKRDDRKHMTLRFDPTRMPKRTRDPPPYPDDAFKRWRGNQYDFLSNRDGDWALASISKKRTSEEDGRSEVRDKRVKKVFFADEDMGDDEDTDSESTPQARGKKRDRTEVPTVDEE